MEKKEPELHKVSSKRTYCELNMQRTYTDSDYQEHDWVKWGSSLGIDTNENASVTPAFCSDSKFYETGNSLLKGKEREIKPQNKLVKRPNSGVLKIDGSDSSLKLKPSSDYQLQSLVRRGSNLEIGINRHAPVTPTVFSDSKGHLLLEGQDSDSHVTPERKITNENNDVKQIYSSKKNDKSLNLKAKKPSIDTNPYTVQERKTQPSSRSTLLIRSSIKGSKSQNHDYVPYTGKRTVLAWLIESKIVEEGAQVNYMNRDKTKTVLKGQIFKDGIRCECGDKIITVSEFEAHTGRKSRQPYQNIYLENGVSLLQCQIEAWNQQDKAKRCGFNNLQIEDFDENDDACGLCGDGGDLMCCDGCPSTFHRSCIRIKTLTLGDWYCPNCSCKFCERSSAQGNTHLRCRLCERKYHESCKEEVEVLSDGILRDTSFCGKKCEEVYNQLQKLLNVKHKLEAGFSWSIIHRTDIETDTTQHEFSQMVECNSKLAVALSVIEECFLPINDRRSGINMIQNVVYNRGSNYSRFNHSGFYTVILERSDEIIAAASIRIHGTQLAEMPFIGTRHTHRLQGMCRRLLSAIESALSSLKVEKLIITVNAEHMQTWARAFGFNPLEKPHKKEMRSLNMVVFPGIEMLQKVLSAESGANHILST